MLEYYPRHLFSTIAVGLVVLAIGSAVISVAFLIGLGLYHLSRVTVDRANRTGQPK